MQTHAIPLDKGRRTLKAIQKIIRVTTSNTGPESLGPGDRIVSTLISNSVESWRCHPHPDRVAPTAERNLAWAMPRQTRATVTPQWVQRAGSPSGSERQSMEPKRIIQAVCLARFWTCITPSFFPFPSIWNGHVCPVPFLPLYFRSTGFHWFTAGEEFCLSMNLTPIWFRWFLDKTLDFWVDAGKSY